MQPKEWTEWMGIASNAATAIGAILGAVGVWFAYKQIKLGREQAVTQFEDEMVRQYREIVREIPITAFFNRQITEAEHEKSIDDFYRYFDLSNEQVFLRQQERVGKRTWDIWSGGIQSNLNRPAFGRAWEKIKQETPDFAELRRLESEKFKSDPASWGEEQIMPSKKNE